MATIHRLTPRAVRELSRLRVELADAAQRLSKMMQQMDHQTRVAHGLIWRIAGVGIEPKVAAVRAVRRRRQLFKRA
jgi:hypothetical protein